MRKNCQQLARIIILANLENSGFTMKLSGPHSWALLDELFFVLNCYYYPSTTGVLFFFFLKSGVNNIEKSYSQGLSMLGNTTGSHKPKPRMTYAILKTEKRVALPNSIANDPQISNTFDRVINLLFGCTDFAILTLSTNTSWTRCTVLAPRTEREGRWKVCVCVWSHP